MRDFLDALAHSAVETINKAYYDDCPTAEPVPASLKRAIQESAVAPIIAEVKGASPSKGTIRADFEPEAVAEAMSRGGAVGISVLTEPKHFRGSLSYLARIRNDVRLPLLMKDIIVSPTQLDAGSRAGANAVLLIQALFNRCYCECSVYEMINQAHRANLEVLLEVHNSDEFQRALKTEADLIGINNRDLGTLEVDLNVTRRILERTEFDSSIIIVAESGINTPADVRFLRRCGAKAFLVGSAIMEADDMEAKVSELVKA
ncbi:MAG: indole-3-glycerol-phosphate synthase [Candidatus Bathyarchaeia archaeon]